MKVFYMLLTHILELQKEKGELTDMCRELERDREKCIAELEKENAELCKDKEQLNKAKELLERLLITSCNSDVLNLLPNCSEVLRVRVEAEQFLQEE